MSKHVMLVLDRGSEIARALEDPDVNEVAVVVNGQSFKGVDEERNRPTSTRRFSGVVREIGNPFERMDIEKIKADINRWRLEGPRANFEERRASPTQTC